MDSSENVLFGFLS